MQSRLFRILYMRSFSLLVVTNQILRSLYEMHICCNKANVRSADTIKSQTASVHSAKSLTVRLHKKTSYTFPANNYRAINYISYHVRLLILLI